MKKLFPQILASGLLACFLFVSIGLASQAAAHTLHHAKHQSSTHASLLCSWVCSAGQVVQVGELGINGPFSTLYLVEINPTFATDALIAWSPPSRAPPSAVSTI